LAKEYLRERKLKEDKAKEDLATKIREEAYNMEARYVHVILILLSMYS
jgi:hypothetical protein